MKKTTLLALLISAAPIMTHAETVTGGVTLSYTKLSNDFGDMETKGLDGRLGFEMDNGFSFGVEMGQSSMSVTGLPVDLEAEFYSFDAKYGFGSGMSAGVFTDQFSVGIDGIPLELTLKTNGVTFGYEGSGFEAEAFYGSTDITSLDVENYGVSGSYTGMEGLEVGAVFHRADVSMGGSSETIDFSGVAATYLVTPSLMAFGGAGKLDLLGLGELESMGLGVSYGLGGDAGFSTSLSLEVARTSLEGQDLDVVRVGLTVPLGKKGPVLPMNSVADSILNPRHGALVAGLTAGF